MTQLIPCSTICPAFQDGNGVGFVGVDEIPIHCYLRVLRKKKSFDCDSQCSALFEKNRPITHLKILAKEDERVTNSANSTPTELGCD